MHIYLLADVALTLLPRAHHALGVVRGSNPLGAFNMTLPHWSHTLLTVDWAKRASSLRYIFADLVRSIAWDHATWNLEMTSSLSPTTLNHSLRCIILLLGGQTSKTYVGTTNARGMGSVRSISLIPWPHPQLKACFNWEVESGYAHTH